MVLIYNIIAALINVVVMVAFKLLVLDGELTASASGLIRNLFGFLAFSPIILLALIKEPQSFVKEVPHKFNIALGVIGGIAMVIWPMVFINIETHIAMTFAFILPFSANLMLMIFCKEEVPRVAWVTKILCMIGVLIILRPKFPEWNVYYSLALVCVLLWSISVIFNKKISQSKAKLYISIYWYLILTTISTLIFSYKVLSEVKWSLWLIFLGIGLLNSIGNMFTLLSFKKGSSYLVQMMEFVKFIAIIFCDIIFFHGSISMSTIIGSVIIAVAIGFLFMKR